MLKNSPRFIITAQNGLFRPATFHLRMPPPQNLAHGKTTAFPAFLWNLVLGT
jgi:hypothetical protein